MHVVMTTSFTRCHMVRFCLLLGLAAVSTRAQMPPAGAGSMARVAVEPSGAVSPASPMMPAGLSGGMGEAPPDLGCAAGSHTQVWTTVKQRFRDLVAGAAPPYKPVSHEALSAELQATMKDLKAVDALATEVANECGFGKLCLQLLSFAAIDDPAALVQIFSGLEQLSSPVLTLLLDVPWAAIAQSGWPFFGLLAQLNLRKANVPGALNSNAVDGLDDPASRTLQDDLMTALAASNFTAAGTSAGTFLGKDIKGSALGPLTALAAQTVAAQGQERLAFVQGLQIGFRQAIGSPGELDLALSTQWPLWGLIQSAMGLLSI